MAAVVGSLLVFSSTRIPLSIHRNQTVWVKIRICEVIGAALKNLKEDEIANESIGDFQAVGEEEAQEGFEGLESLLEQGYNSTTAYVPEQEDEQKGPFHLKVPQWVSVNQTPRFDQLSDVL